MHSDSLITTSNSSLHQISGRQYHSTPGYSHVFHVIIVLEVQGKTCVEDCNGGDFWSISEVIIRYVDEITLFCM